MQLIQTSLYQIRAEHLYLLKLIEESEGELTPEIEAGLMLSQDQFQEKAVSYGFVLKTFDNTTDVIAAEIKRLQELKDKSEKRKELFKQRLSEAMIQFGVEKIETPLLKLSFRKSESVEITDENLLPDDYKIEKTTYSPDKTKIKYYIKEGSIVPGAELITKQNLQVK